MPPILGRILLRHFGPGIRCISLPAQYSTPVDNATQQLPIFERKTLQWTQGRELVLRLTVEHKRGQLIIDILDRPAMARNNSRQHSQQAMQHNHGQQQVKENGHRIWMPITQTRLLVAQMRKLAYDYKFRLWKTKGTGLDRLLENDLGNGLLRTVYTHRVPGQLYGDTQQSALYFSLMKFKIDSAKQRSDMITKQTQAFDADPIEEQQLMELATSGQPLVFISQHILVPNPYHAWQPNIFSILFPASLLNQFVDIVGRMLANPIVGVWDQRDNKDNNDPTTSSNSELQFGPKYFFSTARWQLNARSQRKFQRYTRMPEWFEKRAVPTISSSWAQEQWQPEAEQKQQEMQKQHQQLQINERRMVAQ